MADITSKAAMAPVTPKATDKPQASTDGGGLGGFSSLPSSIHHGLSEKLQGLTEKLQQLGMVSNKVSISTIFGQTSLKILFRTMISQKKYMNLY